MLTKRQEAWGKKAQERLATVGATMASEWTGEAGPLTIVCADGHQFETSWRYVVNCMNRSGLVGCPICSKEAKASFHRGGDAALAELAKHGFTLLSKYQNVNEPLTLRCDRGHVHVRAYKNWKKADIKCWECQQEDVHAHFEREGWTVITPFRISRESMTVRCPVGHERQVKYETWNKPRKPGYNGCNDCKPARHGQDRALSLNEVSEFLQSKGFRLAGSYANSSTPVEVVCDRGHYTKVTLRNLRSKVQERCGDCHREDRTPTPEEAESVLLAQRISTRIYQELVKIGHRRKGWKTRPWARDKADEIFNTLGPRPDGHHLDHIIPCSFFDFRDEEQVKLCWSIENLRWLDAKANISRGNRLTKDEIKTLTVKQRELLAKASFASFYDYG
jgi:hypothetical protein